MNSFCFLITSMIISFWFRINPINHAFFSPEQILNSSCKKSAHKGN